jgi:tRNA G18 (ribose-2'-O)-methylase SpoU
LIDSLDDPRLVPYRQLKKTNDTRRAGLFIVEGEKLVARLLASRFRVHSLLLGERYAERSSLELPGNVPIYLLADRLIEELIGFNFHRGALACAHRADLGGRAAYETALDDAITGGAISGGAISGGATASASTGRRDRPVVVVVCPEVHDPENLGSILRSSAGLGAVAVVAGSQSADPLSRRVLRVSMGASLELPVWRTADVDAAFAELAQRWQCARLAAVLDPLAEPLASVEQISRAALVLGSEGPGLDPRWLALCDRQVGIPMQAGTDSLNVAVAAGILLYHFCGRAANNPVVEAEQIVRRIEQ